MYNFYKLLSALGSQIYDQVFNTSLRSGILHTPLNLPE